MCPAWLGFLLTGLEPREVGRALFARDPPKPKETIQERPESNTSPRRRVSNLHVTVAVCTVHVRSYTVQTVDGRNVASENQQAAKQYKRICLQSFLDMAPFPPISMLTGNIFTAHHGVQNQASTLNMGGTGEGASKEAVSKARHFNFMYWQHFFHPQYKWFALTRLHQAPPHRAPMACLLYTSPSPRD